MSKKISTYISLLLIGMMGFFASYIGDNSIIIFNTESVSAAGPVTCGPGTDPATCIPSGAPAPQNAKTQELLQSFVTYLNTALDILTIIVSPSIILASWLMSPDWTSGDLFQIRPMIHDLWVTVSNITYFIYAILLIFIALATIFNSENYGYKQLLPKLALGILMVPLSWWFIQFTISLATVVTAGVINIPTEVVINYNKGNAQSWWNTKSIPMVTKYDNDKTTYNGTTDKMKCEDPQKCLTPQEFIQKSGGMYSSLMIYSASIFKFQDVKVLSSNINTVKSIGQIINQAFIGAIMFLVFGLLVIALIFMLLMRAIKLWFYAIFSPFMTLNFVLGDKLFGESGKSFDVKEFIGLAFVPAIVGLCLSFGLVIVSVMLKPTIPLPGCSSSSCSITLFGNAENTIKSEKIGNNTTTTATVGGASYIFTGDVTGGSATGDIVSALNLGGGILGTIIINIIALIFIWVAFKAAMGVSAVAKAAFEPFEAIGNKLGSLAKSLPRYAPILPSQLGGSMSGLEKTVAYTGDGLKYKSDKAYEATAAGQFARNFSKQSANATDLVAYRAANSVTESKQAINIMRDAITKSHSEGKGEQNYRDSEVGKEQIKLFERLGKDSSVTAKVYEDTLGLSKNVAEKLDAMIKAGKFGEEERAIISARFAGNKEDNLTGFNAKKYLESKENAKAGGTNNTSTGFNATLSIDNKDLLKVILPNNHTFEFNIKTKKLGTIDKDDAENLKQVTRDDFKKVMLAKGISENVIKDLLSSITPGTFKGE